MGTAMYHGYVGWPYRQGPSVTRDRLERGFGHMGMARRAWLRRVDVRPG